MKLMRNYRCSARNGIIEISIFQMSTGTVLVNCIFHRNEKWLSGGTYDTNGLKIILNHQIRFKIWQKGIGQEILIEVR